MYLLVFSNKSTLVILSEPSAIITRGHGAYQESETKVCCKKLIKYMQFKIMMKNSSFISFLSSFHLFISFPYLCFIAYILCVIKSVSVDRNLHCFLRPETCNYGKQY